MKKLGLIGGLGPESTLQYYKSILYGVQKRVGADFFPNITIESLNVFKVFEYCGVKDYDGLASYLLAALKSLANAGADFGAIGANTPILSLTFYKMKLRYL